MHNHIPQHQEHAAENGQPGDILPQGEYVEAEARQNGRARDFDVEAVLFVDEGLIAGFVDDEAFEGEVEDGELERRFRRGGLGWGKGGEEGLPSAARAVGQESFRG